jgi:hypothetical protein
VCVGESTAARRVSQMALLEEPMTSIWPPTGIWTPVVIAPDRAGGDWEAVLEIAEPHAWQVAPLMHISS